MTSSLAQLRRDVAADLVAGGVPAAFGHVPERLTPPAAVVLPDEPYIAGDDGAQCGAARVRLRVVLITSRGTNEAAADRMDELIVQAVAGLEDGAAGVELVNVAEPMEVELNGATYLGTVATLESLTRLEII